jgi:cytidine deaminase
LCQQLELNVGELARQLLVVAQHLAIAPVSNFHVAAVGLGTHTNEHGIPSLYLGANLEINGAPLTYTMHAEQSVMSLILAHGDELSALALNAVPCGHCRQFLWEFSHNRSLPILLPGDKTMELADLLPAAFGPLDLGIRDKQPEPFAPLSKRYELAHDIAAHASAHCYVPYSASCVGCALSVGSGKIYPGIAIENAAFNPSLGPLMVALNLARASEPDFSLADVTELYVVELAGQISYQAQLQAEWTAIAPDKPLHYQLSGAH